MAYDNIEPFGAIQQDFRAGQVAAVVANVNRGKETAPFVASDFMPSLRKPPVEYADVEEHSSAILAMIGVK
jgi:hypothetical protein